MVGRQDALKAPHHVRDVLEDELQAVHQSLQLRGGNVRVVHPHELGLLQHSGHLHLLMLDMG